MRSHTPSQPQKSSSLPQLLVYCLLLSFLLHLLFIWLLPHHAPEQEPLPADPTYVTLEELPPKPEQTPKQMEIDETPLPDQEQPDNAKRLAEANQKVEKEMAPRGEDSRDQAEIPPAPETGVSKSSPETQASSQQPKADVHLPTPEAQRPEETGLLPPESEPPEEQIVADKKPSLQELTKLAPDTLERMASKEQRKRVKDRDDVLEGDAVYLNLQHDFLISFFKRFSNRIEAVWNYPEEAARRGEQGVLLLKITVTRDGKLLDVDLLDSSGSDILDSEAIQAIYRAAPFGPVTKHWPHEQMKIYAHFQYTLTNRFIYGK